MVAMVTLQFCQVVARVFTVVAKDFLGVLFSRKKIGLPGDVSLVAVLSESVMKWLLCGHSGDARALLGD